MFSRLVWPGGARRTGLYQPVVVLMMIARTPTWHVEDMAVFEVNGYAKYMSKILALLT